MKFWIDPTYQTFFESKNFHHFEDFWQAEAEVVDEPNFDDFGWSYAACMSFESKSFFLKRQRNYLKRTLPFGRKEPSFFLEYKNILKCERMGIPTAKVVAYGASKLQGEKCAFLVTEALSEWMSIDQILKDWASQDQAEKHATASSIGQLLRNIHRAKLRHGCFYPKHVFVKKIDQNYDAKIIDLEKVRRLRWSLTDRIRDIEPFLRRATVWDETDVSSFLCAYLNQEVVSAKMMRLLHIKQKKQVGGHENT